MTFGDRMSHRADPSDQLDISYATVGAGAAFVEFVLAPGQGVVLNGGAILRFDPVIAFRPWPGNGSPRWLCFNTGKGPARIVAGAGGRAIAAFNLADHGGRLLCPYEAVLATGPGITATVYCRCRPAADPSAASITFLRLEGHGRAFLSARGGAIEERLAAGQSLFANLGTVAAMAVTVDLDLLDPSRLNGRPGFARLTGPGRVWLQAIDPETTTPAAGAPMTGHPPARLPAEAASADCLSGGN